MPGGLQRCETSFLKIEQILGKAHAVVAEDHLAKLLGLVEVHIGSYTKVTVTLWVAEGLTHMPHMVCLLVFLINVKVVH